MGDEDEVVLRFGSNHSLIHHIEREGRMQSRSGGATSTTIRRRPLTAASLRRSCFNSGGLCPQLSKLACVFLALFVVTWIAASFRPPPPPSPPAASASHHHQQQQQHLDAVLRTGDGERVAAEQPRQMSMFSSLMGVRHCSKEEADMQYSLVDAAKIRGCPPEDDIWMRLAHLLMPNAKIFLDIGSNKGYSGARFFSLWNPELGVTSKQLHKSIRAVSSDPQLVECGACSDCRESSKALISMGERICGTQSTSTSNPNYAHRLERSVGNTCSKRTDSFRPIRVYSFDGSKNLVEGVHNAIAHMALTLEKQYAAKNFDSEALGGLDPKWLPNPSIVSDTWTVELSAFTDEYYPGKTITFIVGRGETNHIVTGRAGDRGDDSEKLGGTKVVVPCLSVDAWMEREGLSYIDVLKVDTEGHDAAVLRGAEKALAAGHVGLVLFEYNEFWDGESRAFRDTVEKLTKNKYVCYMEGKNSLIRLSYCWPSETFSLRAWSNVWCAFSGSQSGMAMISAFDSFSLAFFV